MKKVDNQKLSHVEHDGLATQSSNNSGSLRSLETTFKRST